MLVPDAGLAVNSKPELSQSSTDKNGERPDIVR